MLRRVKELDEHFALKESEQHERQLRQVRAALQRLGEARTVADLSGSAVTAICDLGFDRAILSTIDEGAWLPRRVMVAQDPGWAAEIEAVGTSAPMPLGSDLPETGVVRRRTAVVVDGVQEREVVHKPIADASRCEAYVTAPVVVDGRVVGLVHGDAYYQGRALAEADRLMLALLAEDLGRVLAHTTVLEALTSAAEQIGVASRELTGLPRPGGWGADTSSARGDPRPGVSGPSGAWGAGAGPSPLGPRESPLTRREVEVLGHMAAGSTNAQTARRLVVSEGTVKTHVKHILRKLGAANRAEAVSIYWASRRHAAAHGASRAARGTTV